MRKPWLHRRCDWDRQWDYRHPHAEDERISDDGEPPPDTSPDVTMGHRVALLFVAIALLILAVWIAA